MHISEAEVRLSAGDLRELLEQFLTEDARVRLADLRISGQEVRARVQAEGLGVSIPVEVSLQVDRVEPQRVTCDVRFSGLSLIPAGMQQGLIEALARQYLPPGVQLAGGKLTADLTQLAAGVPATCTLKTVEIAEPFLRVGLTDLRLAVRGPLNQPAAWQSPVQSRTEHPPAVAERPEREVGGQEQTTYETIRERIRSYLGQSLPGWMQPAVPWLLLLPDLFVLLVRLARDERVGTRPKLLAAAAVAYIALPLDLLPDFIPGLGLLDDVALSLVALEGLIGMSPHEVLHAHWPGDEDLLKVVRDGLDWAGQYYPRGLIKRLREWLQAETEPRGEGQ